MSSNGLLKRQLSVKGSFLKLLYMSDKLQLLHNEGGTDRATAAIIHFVDGSLHLQFPANKIFFFLKDYI